MKLRNKKTGEIVEDTDVLAILASSKNDMPLYRSLAKLNDDWEDYKTTEPYIDNEEIREIVRAWAKVNDAMSLKYNYDENSLEDLYRNEIYFNMGLGLEDGKKYTIAELCGEEE